MYMRAFRGEEKTWGLEHTSTLGTVNTLGLLYTHAPAALIQQAPLMQQAPLNQQAPGWQKQKKCIPSFLQLSSTPSEVMVGPGSEEYMEYSCYQ